MICFLIQKSSFINDKNVKDIQLIKMELNYD